MILKILANAAADAQMSCPGPIAMWIRIPRPRLADPVLPISAENIRLLHIGGPDDPDAPKADHVLDRRGCVLLPGFVNAHAHLDLTSIGPRPHDPARGFVPWVDMVRSRRPTTHDEIKESISKGVELSLAGGVVAVGDILGAAGGRPTTAGLDALMASPLTGVGFIEFFGIGARAESALDDLDSLAAELAQIPPGRVRPGLQPHAPNSVSIDVYKRCTELARKHDLPLTTHLAETPEERRFIAAAAGPQRELLERLGIWDDGELDNIGQGRSPVEHLAPILAGCSFLVAHVNDADDDAIATLARTNSPVAYCPRASDYFGAPERLGPHRYRDMLDAGVNVCLGTDSIINLDTPGRISVLDEARLLFRRDGAPPQTLLAMMTTHGAAGLGLDPSRFLLTPGADLAGLVTVRVEDGADPVKSVMGSDAAPELLLIADTDR